MSLIRPAQKYQERTGVCKKTDASEHSLSLPQW